MEKHNQLVHPVVSWLRIGFGGLVLVAVAAQLLSTIQQGRGVVNFFSFFTIESNLLAAFVLLVVGFGALAGAKAYRAFALLRGAATLYMMITGIVFVLLLSGLEQQLQLTMPWVNIVLHYIMPIVMLVDWLLFPPKFVFASRHILLWLIFPLLYLAYSWIRGAMVDWYPYPFLHPQNGWVSVMAMTIAIAAGTIMLARILILRTQYKTTEQ
jgi:hypothetical protein